MSSLHVAYVASAMTIHILARITCIRSYFYMVIGSNFPCFMRDERVWVFHSFANLHHFHY